MEMLKNVYYKLEENHQAGLSELFEELEAEGICRIVAGERNKSWQNREGLPVLASRIQTGILPVPRWYCRICWMWMCRC